MTNPNHVFISKHKTKFYKQPDEAYAWLEQFPEDTFSHLEWESYAWPGGYPMYYIVKDGGVLCPRCANKELYRTIDPDDDQFFIVAADINYEDQSLYCDHCNSRIQSAYGEDES